MKKNRNFIWFIVIMTAIVAASFFYSHAEKTPIIPKNTEKGFSISDIYFADNLCKIDIKNNENNIIEAPVKIISRYYDNYGYKRFANINENSLTFTQYENKTFSLDCHYNTSVYIYAVIFNKTVWNNCVGNWMWNADNFIINPDFTYSQASTWSISKNELDTPRDWENFGCIYVTNNDVIQQQCRQWTYKDCVLKLKTFVDK